MAALLRKYNAATTINFELFEVDGVDLRVDAVHVAGDTKIMKDEGAEADTGSGFVDEGQGYSIALTATEMTAARVVVYVVDLTATKVWLDRTIVIETYGNAAAQHAFDLDKPGAAYLTDIHLDHMFAADYDPASIPGVAGALFNELVENDGDGAVRYTTKALENVSVFSGGALSANWKWSTNTAETDPTTGKVKADNAALASVTKVFISEITDSSGNAQPILDGLAVGDTVLLNKEGAGNNFLFATVNGAPVDQGGWWTLPVSVDDSGGSFGNNNTIVVTFIKASTSAAAIADQVWDELRSEHTTAGSFGEIGTPIEIADALLDRVAGIETGFTPRQALRLILAALVGKLSGAATTNVLIRDVNDTKDRINATVDASGNRTAVTKDTT